MIFVWFFKLIFFCLKRFVAFLSEIQVLLVLTILFLMLMFLIYREFKKGVSKVGSIYSTSRSSLFPGLWDFLGLIIPGLDKVSARVVSNGGYLLRIDRTGRISLN